MDLTLRIVHMLDLDSDLDGTECTRLYIAGGREVRPRLETSFPV